jgi:hypothetical protein
MESRAAGQRRRSGGPELFSAWRFALNRIRLAAVAALAVVLALSASARDARAAAEIYPFNLALSAIPSSISGGGINRYIDQYNAFTLEPRDLNSLDKILFGWMFDAELRYFVRQNIAVSAGVGHMKSQSRREYLPLINQSIDVRAEVLTVPVHAGADYYFTPYNQGDFQARAYMGGGVLSNVYSRATFQQSEVNTDALTSLGGSFLVRGTRDSPGFYVQTGVHMFFASRWSVMLGGIYRSARIEGLENQETGEPLLDRLDQPMDLDLSGGGVRFTVLRGF